MGQIKTSTQESRSKVLSLACTPSEHKKVHRMAKLRGKPVSDLLRKQSLEQLVADFDAGVNGDLKK